MNKRIIAIGDIHGCYYTMTDLIKECNIDFENDTVVFLGDMCDRGEHPLLTMSVIKQLQEKHPNNVVALLGNHEDMMKQYCSGEDYNDIWFRNGGNVTNEQLQTVDISDRHSLLNWAFRLPLRYETEYFKFCHSGYWFEGKDNYGYDRVLWDRDWMILERPHDNDDRPIIFGHTPHKEPTRYGKDLCIDTGCVYYNYEGYGTLTACVIEGAVIVDIKRVRINEQDRR